MPPLEKDQQRQKNARREMEENDRKMRIGKKSVDKAVKSNNKKIPNQQICWPYWRVDWNECHVKDLIRLNVYIKR